VGPETQRWQGDVYKTTYMKNKHGEDAVWVFFTTPISYGEVQKCFLKKKCKSATPGNDGSLLKVMHHARIFLWQMESSNLYTNRSTHNSICHD